jgi:hypothetical protein
MGEMGNLCYSSYKTIIIEKRSYNTITHSLAARPNAKFKFKAKCSACLSLCCRLPNLCLSSRLSGSVKCG